MKTKREVLKQFAKDTSCDEIRCDECPYHYRGCLHNTLIRIGAMAILRMFKEKKKPTLAIGTKIKFSDGSVAIIEEGPSLRFDTINGHTFRSLSYLIGKVWEVVE